MATIPASSSSSSSSSDVDSEALLTKISPSFSFVQWNTGSELGPPDARESNDRFSRLRKIDSRPSDWSLYKRDADILCVSFFLVFMSYSATQNLESSINNKDKGLGSLSLGILYTCFTIFSFGAPEVVKKLGPRTCMLCALSGYWLFVAANLFPSWYSLVPASIFLGFCAAILWVAQGSYLTYVAKGHSALCGIPEEQVVGNFSGQFWSLFASTQVFGNLLVLSVCLLLEPSSVSPQHITVRTQRILFGVLLLSLSMGTVLAFFLRHQSRETVELFLGEPVLAEETRKREGEDKEGGIFNLVKGTVSLLGEKKMGFLVPLLAYSGFQQAFIWNDFTESLITARLGISWVGGLMAFYGVTDALSSSLAGRMSSGLKSISNIIAFGLSCQALITLFLLFGPTMGPVWWEGGVLFLSVGVWGIGDGILNSQISALLSILFSRQTEAAFAQWKVWQCLATSLTFFAGPYLALQVKLVTIFVTFVASLFCFFQIDLKPSREEIR